MYAYRIDNINMLRCNRGSYFDEVTLHGWNGEGPPSFVRQNCSLPKPHPAILTPSTSFAASKVNLIIIRSNNN